jgi:hypothetical protein
MKLLIELVANVVSICFSQRASSACDRLSSAARSLLMALSSATGRVDFHWSVAADELLLTWQEQGGPPLDGSPQDEGFGSLLARGTVEGQLGGRIFRDWRPEGLLIRLSVHLNVLAAELGHRQPRLVLLQHADDLLLPEPALAPRPSPSSTDPSVKPGALQGARSIQVARAVGLLSTIVGAILPRAALGTVQAHCTAPPGAQLLREHRLTVLAVDGAPLALQLGLPATPGHDVSPDTVMPR